MPRENAEVVRRFFEAVERLLEAWEPSGSLHNAMKAGDIPPAAREALGYLDAEAEWNAVFSGEAYRGQLEIARGWDELLEAAENYRLELLEVTDLADGRVLAGFGSSLQGRSSGINVNAALFAVITLRCGFIARLDEYIDRREALEAVGLHEETGPHGHGGDTRRAGSRGNLDLVRSTYAEWARGNMKAGTELFDSRIVFESFMPDASERVVARGPQAIDAFMREFLAQWRDYRLIGRDFREVGSDRIVVDGYQSAIGRGSGAAVSLPMHSAWTFREGKVVRLVFEPDMQRALEAVAPRD